MAAIHATVYVTIHVGSKDRRLCLPDKNLNGEAETFVLAARVEVFATKFIEATIDKTRSFRTDKGVNRKLS